MCLSCCLLLLLHKFDTVFEFLNKSNIEMLAIT